MVEKKIVRPKRRYLNGNTKHSPQISLQFIENKKIVGEPRQKKILTIALERYRLCTIAKVFYGASETTVKQTRSTCITQTQSIFYGSTARTCENIISKNAIYFYKKKSGMKIIECINKNDILVNPRSSCGHLRIL